MKIEIRSAKHHPVFPRAIFATSAKSNRQSSDQGVFHVLESRFIPSFHASWAKNSGDSSVRGIKASKNRKHRNAGKLSIIIR